MGNQRLLLVSELVLELPQILRAEMESIVLMDLKAKKELRKVKVVGGVWVYDHNSS